MTNNHAPPPAYGGWHVRLLARPLPAAAVALLSATVAATTVFATPEREVTIEYRDDDHVRMRAADDTFFVIREGKGYMVGREGKQWHVVALDDMAGRRGAADDHAGVRLRDTGRRETVAAIPGQVYASAERDPWTGQWGRADGDARRAWPCGGTADLTAARALGDRRGARHRPRSRRRSA